IDNKCEIYETRSIICRPFGASEDPAFQCPHGYGPESPLTLDETRSIMEEWLSSLDERGSRHGKIQEFGVQMVSIGSENR
ncbi:MAG TPA: hypothetical protein VMC85_02625, partial [Desulfomonilaceae bacterium]|nr:hypothetical protein [Desulfomonilaceae bacterium]